MRPNRPLVIKLNLEIHVSTTQEGQTLVAAIQALPGQFAAVETAQTAALQQQLDAANAALAAEKQNHADDLAAASAAVQAATPQPPA